MKKLLTRGLKIGYTKGKLSDSRLFGYSLHPLCKKQKHGKEENSMKKEPQLDANGKRKFGIRDKLAYAAGDLGCNMSFSLKGTVQTFWLVYMMLETGLLSILLLLVQIWDAVNDPLIGSLIDNDKRKYKLGKFKTYIFIGACGLLVGGAAVFLPFPNAPLVLKAVLFVLGYIVWDAFYTIANVPYGSMLSLVTEDVGERAQLSTWRSIGSMIGNILPNIIPLC
jgi:GPH family glycoside/pentoside/hexuronide:cation symporter